MATRLIDQAIQACPRHHIKWPDAEWSPRYRVFANNFVIVGRGVKASRYWYPPEN